MNNNCRISYVIWNDRGIILSIIYMILKKYKKLKNRILIINNKTYRTIIKQIFPELTIDKYREDNEDNFYFNIRTVIKEQDIYIDIIKNYDKYVHTKKIYLLPWYDMNDPLIVYSYNSKYKIRIQKFIDYIDMFTKMKRCNYNGSLWDTTIEYNIFKKYNMVKPSDNIRTVYSMFNQYVIKNYHSNLPVVKYMTQYSVNNISTPSISPPNQSLIPPSNVPTIIPPSNLPNPLPNGTTIIPPSNVPKPLPNQSTIIPPSNVPKPLPNQSTIIPPSNVPQPKPPLPSLPDNDDDGESPVIRKPPPTGTDGTDPIPSGQTSVYQDKSHDINELLDALNKKIESINNILRN